MKPEDEYELGFWDPAIIIGTLCGALIVITMICRVIEIRQGVAP